MHEHISYTVSTWTSILTGHHASCLRTQSRKAGSVSGKGRNGSSDAGLANRFGEGMGYILVTGDKAHFNQFSCNEIPDEMQSEIHVFGAKAVLADLT
jgi:hypothetical protein